MNPHIHHPLPSEFDRLAMRHEPRGRPLMHQDWVDQLFLHWSVDPVALTRLLPPDLELDLFRGQAWIGITPFRIENTSPGIGPHWSFAPPFHELNVRTYVYRGGRPAVWFFSLDAESPLAVWAAQLGYRLPYYHAAIESKWDGNRIQYRHRRQSDRRASFHCVCQVRERLPVPQPGSFEFFVVERYALFAARDQNLYRARIHHEPWTLFAAEVESVWTTLFEAQSLPIPLSGPIAHYSPGVSADIWAPETVR